VHKLHAKLVIKVKISADSRISQNLTEILIFEVNEQKTDLLKTARLVKFGLSFLSKGMSERKNH